MKKINENEKRTHDFMAMELLCPNADKTDANRLFMFGRSHISQAANLAHPEKPLVFTNFEDQVGDYSDLGFNDTDDDIEVLAKIQKNENVYYLFYHNLTKDTYDIIERREEFWLTEKFGFTMNNEKIDSIKEGEIVPKGTRLNKCYNYDEENNFMYGTNLRTIYYTEKCKTLEDPLILSKSAAEKLKSYNVTKIVVMINNNDILLNLGNDPIDYIAFPDINEYVDYYLCVLRRLNYEELYRMDDLTLNSLRADDKKFYAEGKVVDIDIYSNLTEKDLEGDYNKQLKKLLIKHKKFNNEFFKATSDIIENNKEKCSSQLIQLYNAVKMERCGVKFSHENSEFNGIVLRFTLLKENKLVVGSKISNRYGGKGVVSELREDKNDIVIVDDSQMPIIKSGPFKGLRAEVIQNPLGIVGRLNVSQNYEQEFNFGSMYIRHELKTHDDLEYKEKIYFEFKELINKPQADFERNWYNKLSKEDKYQYMKECEERIYIHQAPFFNDTDFDLLCKMYDKYNFQPFEFEGINIPLIMGEVYFLRLKHDPKGKLSARSTGFENLKNSPSKDNAFRDHKANISKTPIRIGNMELLNLLLTSDQKAVGNLLSSYSSNEDAKERLLEALTTGDPYDINVDLENIDKNENQKLIETLFFNLGIKLEDIDEEEVLNRSDL